MKKPKATNQSRRRRKSWILLRKILARLPPAERRTKPAGSIEPTASRQTGRCTRLCMGSINFCEFSAYSFSYFDCLFWSVPRSSLRSLFFATTAVAFSSASLALVSASSAMPPSQDRHSASPATLLSARHPSQATSLFLVAVVPEAMLAHLKHIAHVQPGAFPQSFGFVRGQPARCPEDKHLSVRKAQSELGLSTQHLQVETFLSSLFTQAH